jgi:hypothetical protein
MDIVIAVTQGVKRVSTSHQVVIRYALQGLYILDQKGQRSLLLVVIDKLKELMSVNIIRIQPLPSSIQKKKSTALSHIKCIYFHIPGRL